MGKIRLADGFDDDSLLALGAGSIDERSNVLEILCREHGGKLLSFIKRVVSERVGKLLVDDLSNEIYQETWLQVATTANTGRLLEVPIANRPKFLFGICKNVLQDHFREFRRAPSFVHLEDDVAAARQVLVANGIDPDRSELIAAITDCFEKLKGQPRIVFKHKYMMHKEPPTSRDIGIALQIAETTVRPYLKLAVDEVKDCMRRKGHADKIQSKGSRK